MERKAWPRETARSACCSPTSSRCSARRSRSCSRARTTSSSSVRPRTASRRSLRSSGFGPMSPCSTQVCPNCDGIRATQQISLRVPECRVIVFSAQEDEQVLVQALEAGASGYLSKGSPLTDLIDATRAVHRGEALRPPGMLGALLQRLILRTARTRRGAEADGEAHPARTRGPCARRARRRQRRASRSIW